MSVPFPRFEPRRRRELLQELLARARTWLPEWQPRDTAGDAANGVFEIAARLGVEVAQRLDRVPEKTFRGFLDWVGVRGLSSRAARLPIVFVMRDGSEPVLAQPPVQLQALDVDPPVVFETEDSIFILPGRIASVVAASPQDDAYFLPPPGLLALDAPAPLPNEWRLRARVNVGDIHLQLDPELGLVPGLELRDRSTAQHYTVQSVDKGIVTVAPPYGHVEPKPGVTTALASTGLPENAVFERVVAFAPFGDADSNAERNQQQHALFIGANDVLNVETPAVIEVVSDGSISTDATWSYWGKKAPATDDDWQALIPHALDGHLYLEKPRGAIDPTPVEGRSSRWLRATRGNGGITVPETVSNLRLLVNCKPKESGSGKATALWPWQKEPPTPDPAAAVVLEGVANTAPLVLNAPFYPLGREPRLFDAFYLGCKEAFSKPAARVTLAFAMGDALGTSATAIAFSTADHLILGIGGDGKLHRVRANGLGAGPAQVAVNFPAAVQPVDTDGHPVSLTPGRRPGAVTTGVYAHVCAVAGNAVWYGRLAPADDSIAWTSLGAPPANAAAPAHANDEASTAVLVRASTGLRVYATRAGRLYQRLAPAGANWDPVAVPGNVVIAQVAPIVRQDALPGELDDAEGLVAVTAKGEIFYRDAAAPWQKLADAPLLDVAVLPLIVRSGRGALLCYARQAPVKNSPGPLVAFDFADAGNPQTMPVALVGHGFDFVLHEGRVVAVCVARDEKAVPRPARWDAFASDPQWILADPPIGADLLLEAPVVLGERSRGVTEQAIPASDGSIYLSTFTADLYASATGGLQDVALAESDSVAVGDADLWMDFTPEHPTVKHIVPVIGAARATPANGRAFVLPTRGNTQEGSVPVVVYQGMHADLRRATRAGPRKLRLADHDDIAASGGLLYVQWDGQTRIYEIDAVEKGPGSGGKRVARLVRPLPQSAGNVTVEYKHVLPKASLQVSVRPAVDVSDLPAAIIARLADGALLFPASVPDRQKPLAILDGTFAVLPEPWRVEPAVKAAGVAAFVADAAFGAWTIFSPPRPSNPRLSWEYWNGTGWWQIPSVVDDTADLVQSGTVTFCVPTDLAPTDVVGRSNAWIRARLVGGDYGQESVTIFTEKLPGDKTRQTIDRSSDSIRAPYVVTLGLDYALCCPVVPDYVLTRDSGVTRDQTDANRTAGAVVEYFVPLATTLARVVQQGDTLALSVPKAAPAPPECADCSTGAPWEDPATAATTAGVGDRALYLALDTQPQSGPISILFLVTEGHHDGAFPLRVDVLLEGGFAPVIAQDHTRGLNESGVLVFAVGEAPPRFDLFGITAFWLRLRPNAQFDANLWQPVVRGAYLNAAFAQAAQTQSLELLGSSDGSPNQVVSLARPPVIAGSLVLRVREALSDEDIAALRAVDATAVVDTLGNRQGPWVLWREVVDPGDEAADARVYAFDDDTGEIRFGGGMHGKVPPIGKDCILAERYRTGGGERANAIGAWGELNLITSVQGVERVAPPDGAAGGSDPQDADTTVRFAPANLSARDRAVTLRDLEILALQFSRDVAQVRALQASAGARIVVVMRGPDPRPPAAVQRELPRFLAERASPMLGVAGAISVVAPIVVPIRVDLRLMVDAIENTGVVAAGAKAAIEALLDPAQGGLDATGWSLGATPAEADLAAVLAGIPHLDGIDEVALRVIGADGSLATPPAALTPMQLVQLAADGVRFEFAVADLETST